MPDPTLIGYRPTWAEVNLKNLAFNYAQVKRTLAPGVRIMATVKADGYGHGLLPVAQTLAACGADYFGVASIDEGIRLRQADLDQPVLILGLVLESDIEPLFAHRLTPTVCTFEFARALSQRACKKKVPIGIHIKVDTGMARIGVPPTDAFALISRAYRLKGVRVEGVFTHFAFADMNREFTESQIRQFEALVARLRRAGIVVPFVHAANSMGILGYRQGHFNMVRPGLILYGLQPRAGLDVRLKPVLSLKTKVVFVKRMTAGLGVSYGHTYVTRRATTIVTAPIGYGDGYPRNLSNIAPVLIGGRRFKIAGRVCMDQIMVDVGNMKVKVGDEVVLIGSQGHQRVGAEELAELSTTIPYEIVCGLGSRVPRVYVG